jgi:hypothetical protein
VVLGFFGMSSNRQITPPTAITEVFDVGISNNKQNVESEGGGYIQAAAGPTG